jgi:hypothetical protein
VQRQVCQLGICVIAHAPLCAAALGQNLGALRLDHGGTFTTSLV